MKKPISNLLITLCLIVAVSGCSTPEEKAEKYYQRGMELLDKDPDRAKLEFQNALQLKKSMPKAMYALGVIAERKGDFKATYSLMNEVIEKDPSNIDALVKTGQILLAAGKVDLALDRSNRAFEVDKNNVSALNLRAAIQLKLNDVKGALEYANQALSKDPSNQDAYILLATERLSAHDNLKALEYLDKALSKNEKNLAVQLIRVKVIESLDKTADVDQSFKKMIQLFPDKAVVRQSYAQFLLKHNRQPEAEQQLREIAQASTELGPKLDVVRLITATKGVDSGRLELESYVKKEPENYELAFALVSFYQSQKMHAQEDKLLNEIQQKAGNSANGYKAQSMIAYKLIQAGKKEEASKLLNTILTADKTNGQALTLRARLALEDKNYDAAIIDLRTVTRDSPEAYGALVMLAAAHENSGSPELAEEQYIKAFTGSKFSPSYGIPYAQFLVRRKQPERAEKVFEDMLTTHPEDPVVLRSLAQARISRGDYAGAQVLAEKAKRSSEKTPVADQILGAISSGQNDFEGALNAFKRAHEAAPNDTQPIAAIIRTYMRAGKTNEAITFIDKILKDNPNNIEALLIKGQIYLGAGKIKDAQQIFSSAIASSPKNASAYQQLALTQQRANQIAEAEQTLTKGLTAIPKDFGLMLSLAGVLEAAGRFEDAINLYEQILKERSDVEIVNNNLASLLLDHRNDQASVNRAHELSKGLKNSTTPQFLDTYGWASYKVGEMAAAEKALKSAVDKLPTVAVFHYHLAKVYIARNENTLAKQSLQKSIKLSENQQFTQKDEAIALLKTL